MVNVSSLFGQIVSEIFTAVNFDNLVASTGAERNAKGFHCKTQLVSMLFCHLAGTDSLRKIVNGLKCCNGKLVHLVVKNPPLSVHTCLCNKHATDEAFIRVMSIA